MADVSQSGKYRKVEPKISIRQEVYRHWRQAWYFERLLVALSVVAIPMVIFFLSDSVISEISLSLEADKFIAALIDLRSRARQNNCFGSLVVQPVPAGRPSTYEVKYSKGVGSRQIALPAGFAVSGQVTFDPLGIPDAPANFTIRRKLSVVGIHIDSQGVVSRR